MSTLARAMIGLGQALLGAYWGGFLLLLTCAVLPAALSNDIRFSGRDLKELFVLPIAGVILLSWWITPVGIWFGIYMFPQIRTWTNNESWGKGLLLGTILGGVTAFCFSIVGDRAPIIPESAVFLPIYCALWCALYARFFARRDSEKS